MDVILSGILSSNIKESWKLQLIKNKILRCKDKPIDVESCKRLLALSWTMAVTPKNSLEKDIGLQVFMGWVPYNKETLVNWITEERIQELLSEKYLCGDRSSLFQLLKCILCNLESSNAVDFAMKVLRDPNVAVFEDALDLNSVVAFTNFVRTFPNGFPVENKIFYVLQSLSQCQIKWPVQDSEKQNIESAVIFIKELLIENPSHAVPLVLQGLRHVLSSTSRDLSFALAAVMEVLILDDGEMNLACQNAVDMTADDDSLELTLSRMLDWLQWPHANNSLLWILNMFTVYRKNGRHSVLLNTFKAKLQQVLVDLINPQNRKASFKVVQYIVFTHQQVPSLIQKVFSFIPNVITAVQALDNSSSFLQCLDDLQKLLSIILTGGKAPTSSANSVKEGCEEWLLDHRWLVDLESLSQMPSIKCLIEEVQGSNFPINSVGLENQGNTCYINSVIQALNMTLSFKLDILQNEQPAQQHVFVKFQETLAYLLLSKRPVYCPAELVKVSRPKWLQVGEQQDSQEYLNHLLDHIHEATNSPERKSPVHEAFGGTAETSYTCCNCRRVSVVDDNFFNLHLPFPDQPPDSKTDSPLRLEDMLAAYLKPEVLDGGNLYKCDDCNVLQKAERTVCITDAPNHLVLTLLRFEFSAQKRRRKLTTPVEFPKTLDLETKSTDGEVRVVQYSLYAAVIHSGGSVDHGHYYTYACSSAALSNSEHSGSGNVEERWLLFNDESVTRTSFEVLQNKTSKNCKETAYMLFYVQTSQRSLPPSLVDSISLRLKTMVMLDNLKFMKEEEESKSKVRRRRLASSDVIRKSEDSDDNSPGNGGCGLGGSFGNFDSPSREIF